MTGSAAAEPAPGAAAAGGPAGAPHLATRGDTLGLRLALAFLAVALAAVALLATLTAVFSAADVSSLASRQRTELTEAVAVAAGAAWEQNHSWAAADLSPVLDFAARTGADVQVRDQDGRIVASSAGFGADHGPQASVPVVAGGQRIERRDRRDLIATRRARYWRPGVWVPRAIPPSAAPRRRKTARTARRVRLR